MYILLNVMASKINKYAAALQLDCKNSYNDLFSQLREETLLYKNIHKPVIYNISHNTLSHICREPFISNC